MTVEGNGHGGYGMPKHDQTRTVEGFIVFSEVMYKKVFQHVKSCEAKIPCSPVEILSQYIKGRYSPKFNGRMTVGLTTTAMKYKRAFGDAVPDSMIHQFIAMNRCYGEILERSSFLKREGTLDVIYLVDTELRKYGEFPSNLSSDYESDPFYPMVKTAMDLFRSGLPSREQFMRMVAVAEVMRT